MNFKLISSHCTANSVTIEEYLHEKSGLKHYHVIDQSAQEHAMLIGFPTFPKKDHGVAHILEHLTLAGSKRFPKGDPFMSMISRSAASFLNALTYPDSTRYPVASPIEKDFFNLCAVYFDAVWNPLLSKENFQREGWRIELSAESLKNKPWKKGQTPEAHLTGIVFNEMKGVESDPSYWKNLAEESVLCVPGSSESVNSGGNPCEIPTLSLQELKDFHQLHYSPSNAILVTVSFSLLAKDIQDFLQKEFLAHQEGFISDQKLSKISKPYYAQISKPKEDTTVRINIPRQGDNGYSLTAAIYLGHKKLSKIESSFLALMSFALADHSSPVIENCLSSDYGDPIGFSFFNADNSWYLFSFENRSKDQLENLKSDIKKWVIQRIQTCPLDLLNDRLNQMESEALLKGFSKGYYAKSPATAMAMELFENVSQGFEYYLNIDQVSFLRELRQALNDPDQKLWKQFSVCFEDSWLFIEGEPDENNSILKQVSEKYSEAENRILSSLDASDWDRIAQDQEIFQAVQTDNERNADEHAKTLPRLELEDFSKITPPLIPKIQVKPGWLHYEVATQDLHRVLLVTSLQNLELTSYEIWLLEQSLDLRDRIGLRLDGKLQTSSERSAWNTKSFSSGAWSREFTDNLQGQAVGWLHFNSIMTTAQLRDWPQWWPAMSDPEWEQPEALKALIEAQILNYDQMSAEDCLRAVSTMLKAQNKDEIAQKELKAFSENRSWMSRWKHLSATPEGLCQIYKEIKDLWSKVEKGPKILISIGKLSQIQESIENWWELFEFDPICQEILPLKTSCPASQNYQYITHPSEGNYNYIGFEFKSKDFVDLSCAQIVCEQIRQELVKKIREQGGAYGASCQIDSSMIVLRSFRDPRHEETFEDMLEVLDGIKNRKWTQQDVLQGALALFRSHFPIRTPHEWGLKAALQYLTGYPSNYNEQMLKVASSITPEMCFEITQRIFSQKPFKASIIGQDLVAKLEIKEGIFIELK